MLWRVVVIVLTCASWVGASTSGQERGAKAPVRLETGFDPLIPTLRKWYVPQDLYFIYPWGGYKYTNYAQETYQRYMSPQLEGQVLYDHLGNYLLRGWRLYQWEQEQPLQLGSTLFKDSRFTAWFQDLVVAADSKDQYYTSLVIGNRIRTELTPLTFRKAGFNGVQWDIMFDRFAGTVLLSRVSAPGRSEEGGRISHSDYTNLIGLHGETELGDHVTLGATYVNTNLSTSRSSFAESSPGGFLTSSQNAGNVSEIVIRISDDSPEDGEGAFFFLANMIVDKKPSAVQPIVEGGRQRAGFLEATENAPLLLRFHVPDPRNTKRVRFELVLSNDFRVDVTSNRQTNIDGQPIFLPVTRARGNVRDNTNRQVVQFEYGLPSANQIGSVNIDMRDIWGLEIRGEFARNTQFQRYPNIDVEKPSELTQSTRAADAWFINATKRRGRFTAFVEAFSMDWNYTTRGFIPDQNEWVDYENSRENWFEYIDDDDDQDGAPDWLRGGESSGDVEVFPGLDENNDLISDFNENRNRLPDYDEPFLRHYVDPPEFLFGVDMNNNTIIDRFENDEEADYPYKKGHRGYNTYWGVEILPGVSLTIGKNRQWLVAVGRRSESLFVLTSALRDMPRRGRLEVFHMLKVVKDDIPDPLLQWRQFPGTMGNLQPFQDPLIMQNVVVNQCFIGYTFLKEDLTFRNKFRLAHVNQRGRFRERLNNSLFLGLINKIDYPFRIGEDVFLIPRWKSQWKREIPSVKTQLQIHEWTQIISLTAVFSVLTRSRVEIGVENLLFYNFRPIPDPLVTEYKDDFVNKVFAVQYSERADYQGYNILSNIGFQIRDFHFAHLSDLDTSEFVFFVEVIAGLERERAGGRPAERLGIW